MNEIIYTTVTGWGNRRALCGRLDSLVTFDRFYRSSTSPEIPRNGHLPDPATTLGGR